MPNRLDCILLPSWLVPVEPMGLVLTDHALGIRAGRIAWMGSRQQAQYLEAHERLELPNMLLTPGLVNAHGHAAMSLLRGLADDLPLMTWLEQHIWPAERRWVNADFVRDGTELALAEQLKGGITCHSDMYFYPQISCEVTRQMGMRAQICIPVLDFPAPGASSPMHSLELATQLADLYQDEALLQIALGPHAPYTLCDENLRAINELARQRQLRVQMHVHETLHEVQSSLEQYGKRPLARLAELGLLGPHFQAVHMTQIDEQDLELLTSSAAHVIHCPESNLKLASGFCPVQRLLDAGINLGLGTDGAASNNDLDLLGEARTAALLAKAVAGSATALNAHTALHMATLGGAQALGLDHEIGSLKVGKAADLVAFDLSGLAQQPLYDPVSQLIYASNRDSVKAVWVAGQPLLYAGQLLQADEEKIKAKARAWAQRIIQPA